MSNSTSTLLTDLQFSDLVKLFLLFAVIELGFRFFFGTTVFGLTLPATLYLMHLSYLGERVNLKKQWIVYLPAIVLFPLFIYFSFFVSLYGRVLIIRFIFFFLFQLFTTIYVFPAFVGTIRQLGVDKKEEYYMLNFSLTILIFTLFLNLSFIVINLSQHPYVSSAWVDMLINSGFGLIAHIVLMLLMLQYVLNQYILQKRNNEALQALIKNAETVNRIFDEEMIFLKSNLNLTALSNITGISLGNLRILFNDYYQKDFYLFVAEYRISYAINMINSYKENIKLEALTIECGYASRTSFNKYFQLLTGKLPSEYLNKIIMQTTK